MSTQRRGPGRLFVESRLGEALVELDETVHVGWQDGALDVTVSGEGFDHAAFRVTPESAADVLDVTGSRVTVNGETVTRHELASGDRIAAPNLTARYERSARGVLRATRVDRSQKGGAARTVTAVAAVATVQRCESR